MKVTGIICEYNPLHLGHRKQLDTVRAETGPDSGIVCLMSGNYVQRGAPAIIDKSLRAKAAVLCGADLVLELPLTASLASAEGFASEGVRILSGFCDTLCFGAETPSKEALLMSAQALLSPVFSDHLRQHLDSGLSFPAARQAALEAMGGDAALVSQPNNILAVEYCKAILVQRSSLEPMPIFRAGSYHNREADPANPSATALRRRMEFGQNWLDYVPAEAADSFRDAPLHTLQAGERAMLSKLRTMRDEEFEALPFGSEGLWRKLMHAARKETSLEAIAAATKSKRYTRSRIDRMILCAFLGLTQANLSAPAPYARVLAFNDRGREILKEARKYQHLPNMGQPLEDPYQQLEYRADDLYGLFCESGCEPAGVAQKRRVYYHET